MLYKGSCHCGRVAFEVEGDLTRVTECNCSICSRKGSLLWFVPRERLRLLTSETNLRSYTFGARTIEHRFCVIMPNLPLISAPQLKSLDSFVAFIRNPKKPDGSRGVMPPFPPAKISPEQARELYEYIYHVLKNPTNQ